MHQTDRGSQTQVVNRLKQKCLKDISSKSGLSLLSFDIKIKWNGWRMPSWIQIENLFEAPCHCHTCIALIWCNWHTNFRYSFKIVFFMFMALVRMGNSLYVTETIPWSTAILFETLFSFGKMGVQYSLKIVFECQI